MFTNERNISSQFYSSKSTLIWNINGLLFVRSVKSFCGNQLICTQTHTHTNTHVNHLSKQCPNEVNVKKRVDQNKSGSYLPKRWVFRRNQEFKNKPRAGPSKILLRVLHLRTPYRCLTPFFSWQGDSFPPLSQLSFPLFLLPPHVSECLC